MIYTFYEQLIMIIYFILFGMFLIISYDILNFYLTKVGKNKFIYHAIEVIFWIGMILLSLLFMQRVTKGYVPVYTFLFFIVGIIIYLYFIQDSFLKDLIRFDIILSKISGRIMTVICTFAFPKEIYLMVKKIVKVLIKRLISSFKRLFRKRKQFTKNSN